MANQSYNQPLFLVQSDNCKYLDPVDNPFVLEGVEAAPVRAAEGNPWAVSSGSQSKPASVSTDEREAFSGFLVLSVEKRHDALIALDRMTADEAIAILGHCFNQLCASDVKPSLWGFAVGFSEQQSAAENAAILYAMVNFETIWQASRNQSTSEVWTNAFESQKNQGLSLSA